MKLLLHIGAEKTGTTSVQRWLKINHEALKLHGIWSCRSMGSENNVGLPLLALGRTDQTSLYRMLGATSQDAAEAFLRDGREKLRAEVEAAKAAGCERFFISSEHLHSRLRDPESVASAARIIRPLFESFEILFFVRPQLEAMISFLATKAGGGTPIRAENFETITEAYTGLYDYHACASHWAAEFDASNIQIVGYNRHPDMVSFLRGHLEIPIGATQTPPRSNSGLDVHALAIGNLIRPKDAPKALKSRINSELRRLPYTEKPRPPQSLARKISARFEDGNRRLCEEYAGIEPEDLTPDWSAYDESGNLDKLSAGLGLEQHLRALIANILAADAEPG